MLNLLLILMFSGHFNCYFIASTDICNDDNGPLRMNVFGVFRMMFSHAAFITHTRSCFSSSVMPLPFIFSNVVSKYALVLKHTMICWLCFG